MSITNGVLDPSFHIGFDGFSDILAGLPGAKEKKMRRHQSPLPRMATNGVGSRSSSNDSSPASQSDSFKTCLENPKKVQNEENEQAHECVNDVPSLFQHIRWRPDEEVQSNSGHCIQQQQQSKRSSLSFAHPTTLQIFRLWQVFLNNVHPLVMLFHAPSVQQVILDIATDPTSVNKATEALGFAIYLCAVASMTDSECLELTGESKADSLKRFSLLSHEALFNSDCLQSNNIVVLQALTLYTLATFYMRASPSQSEKLALLTGRAAQLAEALGLHREERQQDLPPFVKEIRRRLFWQVLILDGRAAAAQRLGAGATAADPHFQDGSWDVRRPLNVSDSQLVPSMSMPPSEHDSPTEMLLCSIRIEIEQAMRRLEQHQQHPSLLARRAPPAFGAWLEQQQQLQQVAVVEQTEQMIEQRLLRSCDACIPFHLLTAYQARSWLRQLRLSVYHPRQRGQSLDGGQQQPDERERLFSLAQQVLSYDNLIHSNPRFRRYLWLIGRDVPVDAVIVVLTELLSRSDDNNNDDDDNDDKRNVIDRAWRQVIQIYEDHPALINAARDNPLFLAIGLLTLKAWDSRSDHMALKGRQQSSSSTDYDQDEPPCISRLRAQKVVVNPASFS